MFKNGNKYERAVLMAVLAALLYSLSSPLSKHLLTEIPPTLMASLLYLGAGLGMLIINQIKSLQQRERTEAKLAKQDLPYIISMIILDIAAPVLLMFGLTLTTSSNAVLLNNFETVTTALIALIIFKEAVGRRMWLAILLITISSILLTVEGQGSFTFNMGSILVLLACICWGLENNCTRMLSMKNPIQIVVIKGFGSGTTALFLSVLIGQLSRNIMYLLLTLLLGFIAYGLSIFLYISAQRELGAARASTFYATAPFIGVIISWILYRDRITMLYLLALIIMLIGTCFAVFEVHKHEHYHESMKHEHKHNHEDGHHNHTHAMGFKGDHNHEHEHEAMFHVHSHTPDIHHKHNHSNV